MIPLFSMHMWRTWFSSNAHKTQEFSQKVCHDIANAGKCSWLHNSIANLTWLQVANIFILLSFMMKLPFLVRYFMNNKLNTGRSATYHADDRITQLLVLSSGFTVVLGWYLANSVPFPAWSQISPMCDKVSWLGVFLATINFLTSVWVHCSLGTSWSCFVSLQKDHKLQMRGAYQYARHPLYLNLVMVPISVFLITQNWLLPMFFLPGVLFAFSRIKREELLMIELFGQSYVDYKKRVPAFGCFSKLCGKWCGNCDCGLSDTAVQAALDCHNKQKAEQKGEQHHKSGDTGKKQE